MTTGKERIAGLPPSQAPRARRACLSEGCHGDGVAHYGIHVRPLGAEHPDLHGRWPARTRSRINADRRILLVKSWTAQSTGREGRTVALCAGLPGMRRVRSAGEGANMRGALFLAPSGVRVLSLEARLPAGSPRRLV